MVFTITEFTIIVTMSFSQGIIRLLKKIKPTSQLESLIRMFWHAYLVPYKMPQYIWNITKVGIKHQSINLKRLTNSYGQLYQLFINTLDNDSFAEKIITSLILIMVSFPS